MSEIDYRGWASSTKAGREERVAMRKQVAGMRYLPRISLALVVSDADDEVWIKGSLDSVLGQLYPYLELCICDNGSERDHVSEVLEDYAATDERVRVSRSPQKRGWPHAYNAAVSMTTGEFVGLLGAGDRVAPEALFKVVELLQGVRADVIYTDEDHIDISGRRSNPLFKPYWSPDLLLSIPYVGRLCVMRKSIFGASKVFREGYEGAEEHDLVLRISERTDRIHHLPEVLYHRRLPETSGSDRDPTASSSRALEDALARRRINAAVEPGLLEGSFRIVRRVDGRPRVSVIVSAAQGTSETSMVDELERHASYPVHQIIVAGDGGEPRASADQVSDCFPARALNLAAGKAEGEYLVFMQARARVTAAGWLLEMLQQAQRPEAGAVGCKLLDASGGLRHGGSMMGMSRLTGHPEERVEGGGHYLPLVDHAFNFGAASAECMMVRRTTFERVEGFDDANLPTSLYDLDLSFRLLDLGLLNVYTPYARVVCEAAGTVSETEEIEYVWNRWWTRLVRSLYYQRPPLDPARYALDREALFVLPS
jgi:O-antigen biosynthesis protein